MVLYLKLASVNTLLYGRDIMSDQLSARDWLDHGLKVLATHGVAALKAEPLAKGMGVSRGSFYWHFADIGAFRTAILAYWREVSAERVIAGLEAAAKHENPLLLLLRRTFSSRLSLEKAVRSWATFDAEARSAVQAIDRRRIDYIEGRLRAAGLHADIAQARAQILYWAFVGYALSDKPLSKVKQEAVYGELARLALGTEAVSGEGGIGTR
jgi:AcrR family transcriptional regulator